MDIPDRLNCLFSAQIEQQDDSYRIEIPKREVTQGAVADGETYTVAVLEAVGASSQPPGESPEQAPSPPDPPVTEGETRQVEIEDVGDEGDGITRVERGYVVIVPDTDRGERVTVEITDVRENVAFADVVERLGYYE